MKKERFVVLIDGSNFYFKLKDLKLHRLLNFNFSSFARTLTRKGKMVEYIGFSHKVSIAMVANCSKSRLLTKEDLSPFMRLGK